MSFRIRPSGDPYDSDHSSETPGSRPSVMNTSTVVHSELPINEATGPRNSTTTFNSSNIATVPTDQSSFSLLRSNPDESRENPGEQTQELQDRNMTLVPSTTISSTHSDSSHGAQDPILDRLAELQQDQNLNESSSANLRDIYQSLAARARQAGNQERAQNFDYAVKCMHHISKILGELPILKIMEEYGVGNNTNVNPSSFKEEAVDYFHSAALLFSRNQTNAAMPKLAEASIRLSKADTLELLGSSIDHLGENRVARERFEKLQNCIIRAEHQQPIFDIHNTLKGFTWINQFGHYTEADWAENPEQENFRELAPPSTNKQDLINTLDAIISQYN